MNKYNADFRASTRGARYRTVVFDLDGTLADTAPDLAASINVMLQQMRRKALTLDQVRLFIGDGVHELVRRAMAASGGCSEDIFASYYPVFLDHYENHLADHSHAWPGVTDALQALLSSGVALALCTNKLEKLTIPFLERLGLEDVFAAVIGGDTLSTRKPDPAPLLEAVRRAARSPAIFVGDTGVDIATAEAAGLPIVIVDMIGGSPAALDPRVQPVISDFSMLVDLVLGDNGPVSE